MKEKLVKLQEYLLVLIILTLPFTRIPERFKIPLLGGSLPIALLLIGVFVFILCSLKYKNVYFPHRKYFLLFVCWYILCLFIGAFNYPFYDDSFYAYMRSEGYYGKLVSLSPAIFDNVVLMQLKYAFFNMLGLIKGLFFPLFAIWLIIINLYKKSYDKGLHKISMAALVLSIIMIIYSIPEIIWLWSGNKICADLLSTINQLLYDPATGNGWWPPLLWKNQLRSITMEPSFFGIISSFIIPLLWYKIFVENKKWCYGVLLILGFMLFASKARTGIIVYLGELALLIIISVALFNKNYLKFAGRVLLAGVLSYGLYISGSTYVPVWVNHFTNQNITVPAKTDKVSKPKSSKTIPSIDKAVNKYVQENVTSVVGNKRSNVARHGNTVARIKVGLDYPVFGVGYGYPDMYMKDRIPNFARDSWEIQDWTKTMLEKGFLKSGYPALNEYAHIFAISGIFGLLLFMAPSIYMGIKLFRNPKLLCNPAIFILTIAACGQLADQLSTTFFLTYPLTFSFLYLAIQVECKSLTATDEKADSISPNMD